MKPNKSDLQIVGFHLTVGCSARYLVSSLQREMDMGLYEIVHPQKSKLLGGLEHSLFFHILGMSSSQLMNSIIFQRVGQPPTRYMLF